MHKKIERGDFTQSPLKNKSNSRVTQVIIHKLPYGQFNSKRDLGNFSSTDLANDNVLIFYHQGQIMRYFINVISDFELD